VKLVAYEFTGFVHSEMIIVLMSITLHQKSVLSTYICIVRWTYYYIRGAWLGYTAITVHNVYWYV